MTSILLYISGIITTLMCVWVYNLKRKIKSIKAGGDKKDYPLGLYETKFAYNGNPFDVTFEVQETGKVIGDKNLYKATKVASMDSSIEKKMCESIGYNSNSPTAKARAKDYLLGLFEKTAGGRFIKPSKVKYYKTKTKSEIRRDRIRKIVVND